MPTQVEIGQAGERIVANDLAQKGYATNVDTKGPGSTDIEATANGKGLLVQVKAALSPNEPATLSSDELRNIKSRASNLDYEAWEARATLDTNLNLSGKIQWRKLS